MDMRRLALLAVEESLASAMNDQRDGRIRTGIGLQLNAEYIAWARAQLWRLRRRIYKEARRQARKKPSP